MEERIRAYAYIRVSGKSQLTGNGFDRQEETIQAYAVKAGYEIVEIFKEEAVLGTKGEADRPAFQEMMTAILRNGARTVVIEGLDRLAREYRIQETLLIYFGVFSKPFFQDSSDLPNFFSCRAIMVGKG